MKSFIDVNPSYKNSTVKDSIANSANNSRVGKDIVKSWSNIKYGMGMLAYLLIPPMIPGVTYRHLIIFNVVFVILIYISAFIAQSIKVIKLTNRRR